MKTSKSSLASYNPPRSYLLKEEQRSNRLKESIEHTPSVHTFEHAHLPRERFGALSSKWSCALPSSWKTAFEMGKEVHK